MFSAITQPTDMQTNCIYSQWCSALPRVANTETHPAAGGSFLFHYYKITEK